MAITIKIERGKEKESLKLSKFGNDTLQNT